jgi:nucleoside-diphosphate-sugar epimerase
MANALVTGGAGFIGSTLVDMLVEQGYQVTVLDDFSHGKKEHLEQSINDITLIDGSVVDLDTVKKAVGGADYVFHLAANRSIRGSFETPIQSNRVNVEGTMNVLAASLDAGVKRVIFSASSAIYGSKPETMPLRENMTAHPESPYAIQKLMGEYFMRYYWQVHGLETVSLRYFNAYGPRDDVSLSEGAVIQIFISRILQGKEITIHGTGEQNRDFTFVRDIAAANIAAATRAQKEVFGEPVNVAAGKSITINELFQSICDLTGKTVSMTHSEPRFGDVFASSGDPSRAKKFMDFSCEWPFKKGLEKTIDWVRETI